MKLTEDQVQLVDAVAKAYKDEVIDQRANAGWCCAIC